jgi:hypothetical protein
MKLLRYDPPGQERSVLLGRRRTDPRSVHICAGYYARLSRPPANANAHVNVFPALGSGRCC